MKEAESLKKLLRIYGETPSPVSQGFYQDLSLRAARTIEQLEEEIVRMQGLLDVAKCPNCDGSGGISHQVTEDEWEQEQCQWCDEARGAK